MKSDSVCNSTNRSRVLSGIFVVAAIVAIVLGGTLYHRYHRLTRSPAYQLSLGEKYLSELRYEEAILAFTKVIEVDPASVDAYLGMAQAYTGLMKYDEATDALKRGYAVTGDERIARQLTRLQRKSGEPTAELTDEERFICEELMAAFAADDRARVARLQDGQVFRRLMAAEKRLFYGDTIDGTGFAAYSGKNEDGVYDLFVLYTQWQDGVPEGDAIHHQIYQDISGIGPESDLFRYSHFPMVSGKANGWVTVREDRRGNAASYLKKGEAVDDLWHGDVVSQNIAEDDGAIVVRQTKTYDHGVLEGGGRAGHYVTCHNMGTDTQWPEGFLQSYYRW